MKNCVKITSATVASFDGGKGGIEVRLFSEGDVIASKVFYVASRTKNAAAKALSDALEFAKTPLYEVK